MVICGLKKKYALNPRHQNVLVNFTAFTPPSGTEMLIGSMPMVDMSLLGDDDSHALGPALPQALNDALCEGAAFVPVSGHTDWG